MQYLNRKNKKRFTSYQEVYQNTFGGSNPVVVANELPLESLLLNQTIPAGATRFARPNDGVLYVADTTHVCVSNFNTATLTIITASAQPSDDILRITLFKNGVTTGLIRNISDNSPAGTYAANGVIAFAIGDELSFEIRNVDTTGASAQITSITIS